MSERVVCQVESGPSGAISWSADRGCRATTWPEFEAMNLVPWNGAVSGLDAQKAGDYIIALAERIKAARQNINNSMTAEMLMRLRSTSTNP